MCLLADVPFVKNDYSVHGQVCLENLEGDFWTTWCTLNGFFLCSPICLACRSTAFIAWATYCTFFRVRFSFPSSFRLKTKDRHVSMTWSMMSTSGSLKIQFCACFLSLAMNWSTASPSCWVMLLNTCLSYGSFSLVKKIRVQSANSFLVFRCGISLKRICAWVR